MKPARAFTIRYVHHGIDKAHRILVSDQDACLLRSYVWSVKRDKVGNCTVYRNTLGAMLTLGQHILSPPEGSVVWHFNGDDSDFRRDNLRVSTRADRNREIIPAATVARHAVQ
jgi:hypothetical protein